MGAAHLKAEVQSALPFDVPLVTLPELVMGWGTVAASVAVLLSSVWMLAVPGEFGGQPLVRVLSGLRVVASLLGIWVAVSAWGVVSKNCTGFGLWFCGGSWVQTVSGSLDCFFIEGCVDVISKLWAYI